MTRGPLGGIQLWTALDAAVTPRGDSTARDSAAWFQINVGSQSIARQGYVTARAPTCSTRPPGRRSSDPR